MPTITIHALLQDIRPAQIADTGNAVLGLKHNNTQNWFERVRDTQLPVSYIVPPHRLLTIRVRNTANHNDTLAFGQVAQAALRARASDANATFVVLYTASAAGADAAIAVAAAAGSWAQHYQTCGRHSADIPIAGHGSNQPLTRCPYTQPPQGNAPPPNLATGRGLPPPRIVDARPARPTLAHGNWRRMKFLLHHDMRGDMFTYGAMLVLIPRTFVHLLHYPGAAARMNTHNTFFNAILGAVRAPKQSILRQLPQLTVEQQALCDNAVGDLRNEVRWYYKKVLDNDQNPLSERATNNFSGTSTYLVGQAFERDSAHSGAAVRAAFVETLPPNVLQAVRAYADAKVQTTGLHVVLWSRRGDNGPEWNMSWQAFGTLHELVAAMSQELGGITILEAGDALVADNDDHTPAWPSRSSLIEFWTDPNFPSVATRAAYGADRRCQLALWDHLARKANSRFVHVGNRSGGLEPMVLLGMETIYLEPAEQAADQRGERMQLWHGRLPYHRAVVDTYFGDLDHTVTSGNDLSMQDRAVIPAMIHEALLRAAPQLDAASNDAAIAGGDPSHRVAETAFDWVEKAADTLFDAFVAGAGGELLSDGIVLTTGAAVRTRLRAFETANYANPPVPVDRLTDDYRGEAGYDVVSLSCCFGRAVHLYSPDGTHVDTGATNPIRIYYGQVYVDEPAENDAEVDEANRPTMLVFYPMITHVPEPDPLLEEPPCNDGQPPPLENAVQ